MAANAPLTTVVLALHARRAKTHKLLERMGVDPKTVTTRDGHWTHIRRSEDGLTLVFGPSGLKRVRARHLIDDWTNAGFRYTGCVLALKPYIYTKTDEVWAKKGGQTDVREGQPMLGEYPVDEYKCCIEAMFVHSPTLTLAPQAALLGSMLPRIVWRRARVTIIEEEGERGAIVDLVIPTSKPVKTLNELTFSTVLGFDSYPVDLP